MEKINLSTRGVFWAIALLALMIVQLLLQGVGEAVLRIILVVIIFVVSVFVGYQSVKNVSDSMKTELQVGAIKYKNYFSSSVVGLFALNYLWMSLY